VSIIVSELPPHPEFTALRPRELPAMREAQRAHNENYVRRTWEKNGYDDEVLPIWLDAASPSVGGRMIFVKQEMNSLILFRAGKVPDNTPIMSMRAPAESGMLIFENPLAVWKHNLECDPNLCSPIDAITWHRSENTILVAGFVQRKGSAFDNPIIEKKIRGKIPPWIMLYIKELPSLGSDHKIMLGIIVSSWTLMGEPRVVETRDYQRRGKKGRREGVSGGSSRVTIVNARPGVGGRPSTPGAGGTGNQLDHLVDVAGHYKTFHVGPGRTGRDVRWVSPHTRGPEGAPPSDTIRVLRPDEREK
jgi:hypothetical protein